MNNALYQRVFTMIGEDLIDNSFDQALTEERKLQYASMHSAMHVSLLPPKMPKHKYLLIVIEERNGEQTYTFRVLRQVGIRTENLDKIADKVVRGWYEDGQRRKFEDGGYYFNAGCNHAKVERITPITEDEYNVLSKFI